MPLILRGSSKQSPQSLTILSWVGAFLRPADFILHIFSPTDFTDIHRFFIGRFLVTQISQMTQIFFSWNFYSSDFTEFIRRFPAAAITHGFSRRRPVRSLQIPPETGKSPTDFTDLHRFFLGRYFCHADFADDADFFLMGFYSSDDTEFIRRFPAEAITHGFSQRRPVRSLQIPPESGQRDSTEIP